jgi:hypothetical protein
VITFSTVGDSERAAANVETHGPQRCYFLIDSNIGDQVELGFLYQGHSFSPLNWNEVWNSQFVGEVPINSVRVADRGFVPSSKTPLDVGRTYSTGFLRTANGWLALRPDTLGVFVYNIQKYSAQIYSCYFHNSEYIYRGTTRCKTQAAFFAASVAVNRKPKDSKTPYWYVKSGDLRGCYRLLHTGQYPDLESLVADVASGTGAWYDWENPLVVSTTMTGIHADYRWVPMALADHVMDRKQVIALLRQHHNWLIDAMRNAELDAIPSLHARSFDQIEKFEGNFLVLLSKLDSFGRVTAQSFLDFARSPGGRKDLASLWLANRYGDRLSMSGVSDLFRAIDREFLTIRTKTERFIRGSSRTTVSSSDGFFDATFTFGTNIAVTPRDYNALMKLIRVAYEWDFYPSLANVWDAIPLSFVVDWIGNVGDIFASVDRMVQSHYYDVQAILQSARAEASDPVVQGVQHIYYERRLERSLQIGVESFRLGLPSFINLIDGLALLCG